MELRVLFLLLAMASVPVLAMEQGVSAPEVERVFKALSAGDWRATEKYSKNIIDSDSPAQKTLIARMRYIYLISLSKQLEAHKLSYDAYSRKLNHVLHKELLQPWHSIKADSGSCFNYICRSDDNQNQLFTIQTNNDATQIYSFEYFDVGYPLDLSSYSGQNARMGGRLDKLEINKNLAPAMADNKIVTWYLRLHFSDAYIQYER